MESALRALCHEIQSGSGLSAGIGYPGSLETDVMLWPWRVVSADRLNRAPVRRPDGPPLELPKRVLDLSFLVLAPNALGHLMRAVRCAFDNPVLQVGDAQYELREDPLAAELQVSLLAASSIRMQPVVNFVLTGSSR